MIFFCPDCFSNLDSSGNSDTLYCSKCDCNFRIIISFEKLDSKHDNRERTSDNSYQKSDSE